VVLSKAPKQLPISRY